MHFDEQIYDSISLDELVVFAVHNLKQRDIEATFEKIVAECFALFPKKFALVGYPGWPDSARVNKSWLRCRTDFKYITGSVKSGFKLTSKGVEAAGRVEKKLRVGRPFTHRRRSLPTDARAREENFINQIATNPVFLRYQEKGNEFTISEYELCDIIFCTLETPYISRKKNIELLISYAEQLKRDDVFGFLKSCREKLISFKAASISKIEGPGLVGGMFRKRAKKRDEE